MSSPKLFLPKIYYCYLCNFIQKNDDVQRYICKFPYISCTLVAIYLIRPCLQFTIFSMLLRSFFLKFSQSIYSSPNLTIYQRNSNVIKLVCSVGKSPNGENNFSDIRSNFRLFHFDYLNKFTYVTSCLRSILLENVCKEIHNFRM